MKITARFQFQVVREEDFTRKQKQRLTVLYAKENFICIFTIRNCVFQIFETSINEQFGDLHECVLQRFNTIPILNIRTLFYSCALVF